MDKGLRLLGETLSEGFAIGRLETEQPFGSKSIKFEYINPVLNTWLGIQESLYLKMNGLSVLLQGDMAELYQISEIEAAIVTDAPVTYKVFCVKMEEFLEVMAWKSGQKQFAMVVKRSSPQSREVRENGKMNRINRYQAEAGLKFLIGNMTDVLWRLDENFRFSYISASDTMMRGYENQEVLGRVLWDFLTPEGVESIRSYHQEVLSMPHDMLGSVSHPNELQMVCKDGRMIWVEVNLTPVLNSRNEFEGYRGVARDITLHRKTQNSLLEYRHLMEAVLDNMAQAMVVINPRMEIAAYNKKFLDIFGFDASEVNVGIPFEDSFNLWRKRRKTSRESIELDKESIQVTRSYTREYWQLNDNGSKIWVQLFHNPLPGGGFVRTYSDITDRKRYEMDLYASREKLAVIAATDELTGVMNRRSGFAMLKRMERECLKQCTTFSVCFIDIDGLKRINDLYGHGEGDVALITIAEHIRSSIRAGDAICRIGGDEFMILFPGCEKIVAEKLVQRIKERLADLSNEMGKPYLMSFSYGVDQMCTDDPIALEDLIRRADHLMYLEKHAVNALASE